MVKVKNILWPLDLNYSDLNNIIIQYLKSFHAKYNARLHILYAVPEFANIVADYLPDLNYDEIRSDMLAKAKAHLEQFASQEFKEIKIVAAHVEMGYPTQIILDYAENNNIDLIVMGTQGRGRLEEFILGSVSRQVLKKAKAPVLAINPRIDEQMVIA
jgi:nucleotide-binding universal stress UspA family protein